MIQTQKMIFILISSLYSLYILFIFSLYSLYILFIFSLYSLFILSFKDYSIHMLKKAKVVNIQFGNGLRQTLKTRTSQFSQNMNLYHEPNLQTFMKSSQSTTETYELLNLIRNSPVNLTELMKQQQHNSFINNHSPNTSYQVYEMATILPRTQLSADEKKSKQSIDVDVSRANSTFVNTPQYLDQVKEQVDEQEGTNCFRMKSSFYSPFENDNMNENIVQNIQDLENIQKVEDQYVYIIPQKYANNLYMILMHFLNYKMMCGSKESGSRTANIPKRPRTTVNNLVQLKPKHTVRDSKPLTAICQNRKTHQTAIKQNNFAQDFNQHLQKLMQIQKQLQKKTSKIIFLESQLSTCYQTIRQKNTLIRELGQRQQLTRKKVKYEVDRMAKSKVMEDIGEIYASTMQENKASGRSVFEINGKKFVKTKDFKNFVDSAFLTSPKSCSMSKSTDKQSTSKLSYVETEQCELLSKSQSMKQYRQPKVKGVNKKLEAMKLNKLLDTLTKEIVKFQAERENLLDNLAQNNGKVQKTIEELQETITAKRMNVQKYTEELNKIKQASI